MQCQKSSYIQTVINTAFIEDPEVSDSCKSET